MKKNRGGIYIAIILSKKGKMGKFYIKMLYKCEFIPSVKC